MVFLTFVSYKKIRIDTSDWIQKDNTSKTHAATSMQNAASILQSPRGLEPQLSLLLRMIRYFYHAFDLDWNPIRISEGKENLPLKIDKLVPLKTSPEYNSTWFYAPVDDRTGIIRRKKVARYKVPKSTDAVPTPRQKHTDDLVVLQTSAAGAARKVVSRLKRQPKLSVVGNVEQVNGVRFYLLQRAVKVVADAAVQVTRW